MLPRRAPTTSTRVENQQRPLLHRPARSPVAEAHVRAVKASTDGPSSSQSNETAVPKPVPAAVACSKIPLSVVPLIESEVWGDGGRCTQSLRAGLETNDPDDSDEPKPISAAIGGPLGRPQWHARGVRDATMRNNIWSCLDGYISRKCAELDAAESIVSSCQESQARTNTELNRTVSRRGMTHLSIDSMMGEQFTSVGASARFGRRRVWSSATLRPPCQFNKQHVNKVVTLEYGLDGSLTHGHVEVCKTRTPPSLTQGFRRLSNTSKNSWRMATI